MYRYHFQHLGIALVDYLLRPLDLTPFYFLRIIFSAITSHRATAIVAALVALAFQTSVSILHRDDLFRRWPQISILGGSYLFAALLVYNLSRQLTAQWRDAADAALYAAKTRGRDQIQIASP